MNRLKANTQQLCESIWVNTKQQNGKFILKEKVRQHVYVAADNMSDSGAVRQGLPLSIRFDSSFPFRVVRSLD